MPDSSRHLTPISQSVPADVVDVVLRDGATLRLRPPVRGNADALLDFFRRLSPESLYLRFHGFPSLGPQLVERLLDPDWNERGALLGALAHDGGEQVVAVGEYVRLREANAAEAALVVADAHRKRGIGTRLVEQLAERASQHGIERFVASVLASNRDMLGVFEALGFELSRELSHGEVEVAFPIAATEPFEQRRAERDHVAITASLEPLLEPRTVAVIGASRRRGTIGGELFRNIIEADYTGAAYPVNRDGEPVAGVRAYRSVDTIPDPVDLAVVAVPAAAVLDAAEEALAAGVRALVVISAGFAETGHDGQKRQDQLLALVRSHGARMVGPNCLGISVAGPRLNATFGSRSASPGNLAFSSQSGALGLAMLEAAAGRGLGLSAFVSVGNKADVSTNDLLEWWETDPSTDAILLYVESFGNPRRFGQLARRVARHKPILALKAGTTVTGQAAARSHTAALAGSEAGADALFHQAGVTRVRSLEELIDVATLMSRRPRLDGASVAVLTNAGGLGILCADACEAAGLELPPLGEETAARLRSELPAEASIANPVDMLGSATGRSYESALRHVLSDPRISAVIVLFVPTVNSTAEEVAEAVEHVARGSRVDKPVLAVVMTADGIPRVLRDSEHVAAFAYPESAARALGRAAERAAWLRRPRGTVPTRPTVDRARVQLIVDGVLDAGEEAWLDPAATRDLLEAYGVPVVSECVVSSVEEAVTAARELGFPVVLKTAAAGAHKTETGGIALGLADDEAVRAAAVRIGPPLVLQPMVEGGVELLAGVLQDPVFGPLVAFGPGGVLAELIGEASFRIAPMTDRDAEELVTTGKAGRLVRGFRGTLPADPRALEELVQRLAQLAEDYPAIAELDLNPVIAHPDGCVVVDARVRIARPPSPHRMKSW